MRYLRLLSLAALAAVCSATPVTYSGVSVTCKEFVPNTTTENLTVTVDAALGTITAGSLATNNCYFFLAGNSLTAPFATANYNYTSPQDYACWHTGGFCIIGSSLITLSVAPGVGGQLFTIVASSITTTFTLPGGGGGSPVPEPASLILLGSGLTIFGLVSRRRLRRS